MTETTEKSDPTGDIQAFWEEQARKHGTALAATNPDTYAKDLEIGALLDALDPTLDTLEAGCGNGYNLFRLAERMTSRLAGFDYSEGMIQAAHTARKAQPRPEKFDFWVGDILDPGAFRPYAQIFTDRCLINLPSLEKQLRAMEILAGALETDGRLVLVESTRQGQDGINRLRESAGLDPIPYHWHNTYLDIEPFMAGVPASLEHVRTVDFSSLYFVISRVFNAALTPPGQAPDYMAEINRLAASLPSFGYYGPLKMFEFRKRG